MLMLIGSFSALYGVLVVEIAAFKKLDERRKRNPTAKIIFFGCGLFYSKEGLGKMFSMVGAFTLHIIFLLISISQLLYTFNMNLCSQLIKIKLQTYFQLQTCTALPTKLI